MSRPIKDWTGHKFNSLTFVRPTKERYINNVIWEVLCVCGKTILRPGGNVVSGRIKSCGCQKYVQTKWYRKYDPITSSARDVWQRTYNKEGLGFDAFLLLSQKSCDYCGTEPNQKYNAGKKKSRSYSSRKQIEEGLFIYNGLDRIDSSKGHIADNLVPCCWECNRMKGNRTREQFLAHIKKISGHQSSGSICSSTTSSYRPDLPVTSGGYDSIADS